ncbi:hypothetical protein RAS1_02870 [Phycisphaerae bacterium RAS1]|nr:hypothetical protein RAS1_02870 [Phycisphaerae bacterium RAS1]
MNQRTGYELLDHTADLGVRVTAPTFLALLPVAVEALYATIGDVRPGAVVGRERLEYQGSDLAALFRDFLADLLYRFETRSEVAVRIEPLAFSSGRLAAEATFAAVDVQTSELEREVKAVTYHELALRETPGGVEAHFIVDI